MPVLLQAAHVDFLLFHFMSRDAPLWGTWLRSLYEVKLKRKEEEKSPAPWGIWTHDFGTFNSYLTYIFLERVLEITSMAKRFTGFKKDFKRTWKNCCCRWCLGDSTLRRLVLRTCSKDPGETKAKVFSSSFFSWRLLQQKTKKIRFISAVRIIWNQTSGTDRSQTFEKDS